MAREQRHKTLTVFYLLVAYILLQFGWWAWILADGGTVDKTRDSRLWMVVGEGSVFLLILLLGVWRVRRAFRREVSLAKQEKNFLLSISHEFKSPLASIRLQLETIRNRKLPEQQVNEMADMAIEDTDRLAKLADNLLMAARIESGKGFFQQDVVMLSELAENIAARMQAKHSAGPHLVLSVEEGITVRGDDHALESVLENLLSNAFKYTPDEKTVRLDIHRIRNSVVIQVEDDGPGIPENEREHIFERFYRVEQEETRTTRGTGLGLYIVRYITQLYGGRVEVNQGPTSGARFTVTLPLTND
ncbi:MAG: HAMP domain-containing histidine kinase [Flavobacteriales bacterium]|nr:HAMP domain-containing histidine kinase [Flavobacteriales bacterium]